MPFNVKHQIAASVYIQPTLCARSCSKYTITLHVV